MKVRWSPGRCFELRWFRVSGAVNSVARLAPAAMPGALLHKDWRVSRQLQSRAQAVPGL